MKKIPDYRILLLGNKYDKKELLGMCLPQKIRDSFLMDYDPDQMEAVVTGRNSSKADAGYHLEQTRVTAETDLLADMVQISCRPKDDTADTIVLKAAGDYDKLLVVTSWQLESAYLEALLQTVRSQHFRYPLAEICLILLKSRIRTAATDLDNQDQVLARAYEKYQKIQDIRVEIFQEGDSVFRLIHPCRKILPVYFADGYRETFLNWKNALTDQYAGFVFLFSEIEVLPDIFEEKLQPAYLGKHICGLQNLAYRQDVVKSFYENFYTKCYPDTEKLILDYYKETVMNVCIWDMEQDQEEVRQKLRELYMLRAEQHADKKYRVPENQTEYNSLEQNTGIRAAFYESVTEYYKKDVTNYLYGHLRSQAHKVTELMNRFYKE